MPKAWGIACIPAVVSREGRIQMSCENDRNVAVNVSNARRQPGELYVILEHNGDQHQGVGNRRILGGRGVPPPISFAEEVSYKIGRDNANAGWVSTRHGAIWCRVKTDGVFFRMGEHVLCVRGKYKRIPTTRHMSNVKGSFLLLIIIKVKVGTTYACCNNR